MNIISCENLTKTYGSAAAPVRALRCLAGLRMRLKTVLDQSIVENIREL